MHVPSLARLPKKLHSIRKKIRKIAIAHALTPEKESEREMHREGTSEKQRYQERNKRQETNKSWIHYEILNKFRTFIHILNTFRFWDSRCKVCQWHTYNASVHGKRKTKRKESLRRKRSDKAKTESSHASRFGMVMVKLEWALTRVLSLHSMKQQIAFESK